MSALLQTLLISHVIFGVIGVIALYAVWMGLLKRAPAISFLRYSSFAAFFSFIVSWLSGGYYYVAHYGSAVKPIIKEGAFPWAHLIIMEVKEHIFLVLPFASLTLFLLLLLGSERITTDAMFKRRVVWLAGIVTMIGIFITIAGVVVTGGAQ